MSAWADGVVEMPVLAVVAREGAMTAWLAALCETLCIRMHVVPDPGALADTLARIRPVGVMCGDLGGHGHPISRVLRLVAGYDRALPVLLITSDEPETLGCIDAAADLWPLENMEHAALPVRVTIVLDFLARAGQQHGALRMLRA
ncbi:MAG TPA: hypothetical protein VHS58_19775 [Acetobacteraceae bacterium]|jgi:hypothetical protein|nr:hypothetical protein [Acetobacteraceae bacterium]